MSISLSRLGLSPANSINTWLFFSADWDSLSATTRVRLEHCVGVMLEDILKVEALGHGPLKSGIRCVEAGSKGQKGKPFCRTVCLGIAGGCHKFRCTRPGVLLGALFGGFPERTNKHEGTHGRAHRALLCAALKAGQRPPTESNVGDPLTDPPTPRPFRGASGVNPRA